MHTNYYKKLRSGSVKTFFLLIMLLALGFIFIEHEKIEKNIQKLITHPNVEYVLTVWKTKFWNVFIENIQKARQGGPTIIETPHQNPFNFNW